MRSVRVAGGCTPTTRTPCSREPLPMALVKAARPALPTAPQMYSNGCVSPAMPMTLTMTPDLRAFMRPYSSRVRLMKPNTLSSQAWRHLASSTVSSVPPGMSPALFTRTSTSPHSSARRRRAAPSRRSTLWVLTSPPKLRAAWESRSRSRAAMCTRQPSATKACAQARPMPFEPPVTRTDLPFKPRSIVPFLEEKPMPAYIIAMVNIKDPQKYQEYAKRAGPANAKHGSRFLVRGGKKHALEGDIPFERIVVSEFPDVETARKFYNSPEYQEARRHRLGAAEFHMVIVEGAA